MLTYSPVSRPDLQFVLLPVDDDGGDLLVHEDEDGAEQRGDGGGQQRPPGVRTERRDQPAPGVGRGLDGQTLTVEMCCYDQRR